MSADEVEGSPDHLRVSRPDSFEKLKGLAEVVAIAMHIEENESIARKTQSFSEPEQIVVVGVVEQLVGRKDSPLGVPVRIQQGLDVAFVELTKERKVETLVPRLVPYFRVELLCELIEQLLVRQIFWTKPAELVRDVPHHHRPIVSRGREAGHHPEKPVEVAARMVEQTREELLALLIPRDGVSGVEKRDGLRRGCVLRIPPTQEVLQLLHHLLL